MRKLVFLLFFTFLFAKTDAIIKFENIKPFYYQNQIANFNIRIALSKANNLTIIPPENMEVNLTKKNDYLYILNLKTKITPQIPKVILIGRKFYKELDLNKYIKVRTLNSPNKMFCGVFADNLVVKNPIAAKNDENSTILSFDIFCKNCNISDFKLPYEQNITIRDANSASYYVILPKNQKKLTFYYFNTQTNTFNKITIPIILKDETISTQTNINPEENNFFTPINILILSLIAFTLLIFIIYQKIWLLIFPILLSALLVYPYIPKGSVTLPKNTKVYILPTKQSTVIYITHQRRKVEVLKKLKGYIKVKINNKIGWVRDEDTK
ncbi:hypothetical protein [Caminibacter pacificus]|uniref:SH3 domain-containing protein n=1 Tax=Caminibacter pacificus TaxID=1424653 RepID=A0AAJ4UZ62_9BACT|nr:hypothetical protein [Caminibacter pacificus]NPA87108.1 hypothetical protein [Campylobacterota bacterium]QCI28054.1 hypothetical protein C6V80_03510 [Caminibacter pacificus]ROR41239.1 hypothetical protein EDC58_0726 [Caminibacter pacificus]